MSEKLKPVSLKIPGKLFIAGEYAVTRPGGKALIATVETDFTVTVKPSQNSQTSAFHTNVDLADIAFDINNFTIPDNGWNFALTALQNLLNGTKAAEVTDFPQLDLTITSPLGFGENKIGYGSSASVVVGVVQAVNQFLQLQANPSQLFEYAAKAHRQVQGSGSMGDVAAISSGDVCYYQSPDQNWQNWQIATQDWQALGWQAYIVRTGKSVKTGDKLKINLPDHFYQQSDHIIDQLANWRYNLAYYYPTKKFKKFKNLILKNQQLLIDNLPPAYVTPKLRLALDLINAKDNLVAKISGSGFGENLIVFAKNEKHIKKIKEKLGQKGIILEKIKISNPKI